MSEGIGRSSPREIMSTRVEDVASRDEAVIQGSRSAAAEMTLAFRPRSGPESIRAGMDNNEESQYLFTSPPDRVASQGYLPNTVVHMVPIERGFHRETQAREGLPKYEVTQTGLKFRGNVKGIKFVVTQVTGKLDQHTSERREFEAREQRSQPQGQENEDSGFVKQSGALFFQSLTGSQSEVNQSVKGSEFYKVEQDAVEVTGETIECTFPVTSQHVW